VGYGDFWVEEHGGRKEVFEIGEDERLIGCKLDESEYFFRGVTWIKMKVHKIGEWM
jgi:hypothetical protein